MYVLRIAKKGSLGIAVITDCEACDGNCGLLNR